MPTKVIEVVKNDKLYDLEFTLQDSSGVVIDLTGATLRFKAQKIGENTLKFTGNMDIVSAEAGTCKYQVQEGNFDEEGDYYGEIEVTFAGNQITTFDDILLKVKPELPR